MQTQRRHVAASAMLRTDFWISGRGCNSRRLQSWADCNVEHATYWRRGCGSGQLDRIASGLAPRSADETQHLRIRSRFIRKLVEEIGVRTGSTEHKSYLVSRVYQDPVRLEMAVAPTF
jgi:hypothetical protein